MKMRESRRNTEITEPGKVLKLLSDENESVTTNNKNSFQLDSKENKTGILTYGYIRAELRNNNCFKPSAGTLRHKAA